MADSFTCDQHANGYPGHSHLLPYFMDNTDIKEVSTACIQKELNIGEFENMISLLNNKEAEMFSYENFFEDNGN